MVRRVLHLVREETYALKHPHLEGVNPSATSYTADARYATTAPSTRRYVETSVMFSLFGEDARKMENLEEEGLSDWYASLKPNVIQEIQELIDELENVYSNVASQAIDHVHSNEILLTCGKSRTVETFLKMAAKKRTFQAVVAETGPACTGHEQAMALMQAGITTTVISDAAVFAVMSRMHKVVIGAHAVLANGGLVAVAGTRTIVEAAKFHHIPVLCATGLFKLSPEVVFDESLFEQGLPSNQVLEFERGDLESVTVLNPLYEYIPPEFVNLFLTNAGAHPTSYLCRLLSEHYDAQDTYL